MVKGKYKEALQKAKQLEKKKIRSLKQLEKSDDVFEEEEKTLKKSIGKIKYKKKKIKK